MLIITMMIIVQFSCSVVSDSLWPHGLRHARLSSPSLSPRVCSNSYPLSWRCHPTISSSVTFFSSCPQSFSASGSFPMSWLFTSGGQNTGASASASVLPVNIHGWFTIWEGLNKRLLNKSMNSLYRVLGYQRHTVRPCMVHGAFVESSKLLFGN